MKHNIFSWRRGRTPLRSLTLGLGMAVLVAGCDDILQVEQPDVTLPGNFTDASALPSIRAAAIGEFAVAYSGNATDGPTQVLYSGLLADEWFASGTFPTRQEVDIRNISENNSTLQQVTRLLYRARSAAESARQNYADLGPNEAGHAEVTNLAGYSYVLFGENYCSGVPFSEVDSSGDFVYGEPQSTAAIFRDHAVARFQEAITIAQEEGSSAQENLARIGLGRALLNLGEYEAAAEAVASVPTEFRYEVVHSTNTTREQNVVWNFNKSQQRFSVANNEGGNGLPYRDSEDPRVLWAATGAAGFDGSTPQFNQQKYPARDSNVPLATGIEARLIEAEAALQAGDLSEFANIHNALRTGVELEPIDVDLLSGNEEANLDWQSDPVELGALDIAGLSFDDLVDLHFEERAYWLWLTSHRLGDMRRLVRQYGRAVEDVYPTGTYHKGGLPYGDDVSFPLSMDEFNNPNVTPGQCDSTIP